MQSAEGCRVVALAGNPNVGKSTLFNALTRQRQHTGNWPGKTVALAWGRCGSLQLVDLPGMYSLTPGSPEEAVAEAFLRGGAAEAVVIVCDATCLQRSLVLCLQILARTSRAVVAVNLLDEAARRGMAVDLPLLERRLGVPVCGLSAGRGEGIPRLLSRLRAVLDGFETPHPPAVPAEVAGQVALAESLATAVTAGAGEPDTARAARWDRLLTGRWGIVVMLAGLLGLFWLTLRGANLPSAWLQQGFDWLGGGLRRGMAALGAPEWLTGALVDGIYATTARVVAVMLPPMGIFFPLFSLLEAVGYLPRAAFLADGVFARCGGCGRQALTMAMGIGCNAAGVVGCRIIDSPRERLLAVLTNSMVPCNGRFPALMALGAMGFSAGGGSLGALGAAAVLTALVALGVGATLAVSRGLSATILRGQPSAFVLELPPFRRPRVGQVLLRSLTEHIARVLARAVVVAAPAGLLLWGLATAAPGGVPLLNRLAAALTPVGQLLGLDGAILTGFLLGSPANELVLPVVAMIGGGTLPDWSARTALCAMLLMLFHWPCTTTCLTIRRETGSWAWTALAIVLPTAVGVLLCAVVAWGAG